jgi:hypothetical protein
MDGSPSVDSEHLPMRMLRLYPHKLYIKDDRSEGRSLSVRQPRGVENGGIQPLPIEKLHAARQVNFNLDNAKCSK